MSIFEIHNEFQTGGDSQTTSEHENAPAFFDLKQPGDSAVVAFLDREGQIPPNVKLHKLVNSNEGERYPSWVVDPVSLGQTNHLQEYLDNNLERDSKEYRQLKSESYYCFTVLREGNLKDPSNPDLGRYPSFRQVRLTKKKQAEVYTQRNSEVANADRGSMADLEGLYGNWFYLNRPDEQFIPRIGVIGDFIEPVNGEIPEPFTVEEIQARLVIPTDGLKEWTTRNFNISNTGSQSDSGQQSAGDSEFASEEIPF